MNKKFLPLLLFIGSIAVSAQAQSQKNCFDVYSGTYQLRGGYPVPDGMQKIVVAVKDSNSNAQCVEGIMMVRNDTLILPVYILRENGSYTETYGKLDTRYYRESLGKANFSISNAMSAVFILTNKRKGRIFFPDFLKANAGEAVAAPAVPGGTATKSQPKKSTLDSIKMSAKSIQFENGKAVLSKGSYSTLDIIAELMHNYSDTKWSIDGYTDNAGKDEANFVLSQKRAAAVEDYLVKKGVKPENLFAAGHGPDNPIADNATTDGRKQNRRVEIKPL
jgi:outer membrane protein OmpA-like peptidoglycan-associated protein